MVIAAVAILTGCSWTQVFRLSVTVVDKTDGKPVTGAVVLVDALGTDEERMNQAVPPGSGHRTDEAGRLDHDFSISGYTPTASGGDRWRLKAWNEGYEPVVIDFKPKPPPERDRDNPIPLAVRVEMQPVKGPPR